MRKTLFAIFGSLLLTTVASATVVVDDFSTPTSTVQSCAPPVPSVAVSSGALAATNTMSGERTTTAQVTSLLGAGAGCNEVKTNTIAGNQVLTINNEFGAFGRSLITWDVPGSVDASNETLLFMEIGVDGGIAPNDTTTFTIQFCSDDACTNTYTRSWSITGQVAPPQVYQFDLATFAAAGAPDWANITKGWLRVDSGNSTDLRIDNIILQTPEPSTMILLGSALAGFAMLRRRR